MTERTAGMLVLEDGSTLTGTSMGADGEFVGEVVFNTSMTGYQEIITDPSYWGQMVTFTYPHIGNVGINAEDAESRQPFVRAVIARRICPRPSNWRAQQPLPEYLRQHGVPALSGVDTRRLTLILRERGVLRAALSTVNLNRERLLEMARHAPDMSDLAPVQEVTRPDALLWDDGVIDRWQPDAPHMAGIPAAPQRAKPPHVVVIDCGIKDNMLRHLVQEGARVTVVPSMTDHQAIMALKPDGVLISNGPGDPRQVPETIEATRALFGVVPVFGICLGHQIIAQACGARIYKLPFGHHGGNHPVQDLQTGAIEITAQNHNYAVEPESIEGLPVEVTHRNLYDGTIEGLRHRELPVWCVQYHPEASPGPHDSLHIMRRFVRALTNRE